MGYCTFFNIYGVSIGNKNTADSIQHFGREVHTSDNATQISIWFATHSTQRPLYIERKSSMSDGNPSVTHWIALLDRGGDSSLATRTRVAVFVTSDLTCNCQYWLATWLGLSKNDLRLDLDLQKMTYYQRESGVTETAHRPWKMQIWRLKVLVISGRLKVHSLYP